MTKKNDLTVLKGAILRILESVQEPSRQELERLVGSEAMTLLGTETKKKDSKRKSTVISERAKLNEKQEEIRQALRDADTADEIKSAIEQAKDLDMKFEVALGERKLEKIASPSPMVSSRE